MLTLKTLLGAVWTVSARLANRLIDFVVLLILARGLSPADFGLTALAMTLIVIVETVLEIPLIQALTRLRRLEKSHLDTAFTLGLLRGAVLSVIVLAAAWPFASFYDDPRLFWIIAALPVGSVARGLFSPAMVKFMRELSFRELFLAQVFGKLCAAGAALAVLYLHGGYWAIVANAIVGSLASTIASYVIAPYRPALSLSHFREFSGFLGWFSLGQLVSAVNWQFDRALLGNFLTKADLGKYTMAGDLAALPTQSLIGPAMQPLMAAFSNISDDRDRLRSAYLKASWITMMLAMPVSLLMSLSSDLIVAVILDEEWRGAAVYLRWLSLTILLNAYFQPLYSLAVARGRPVYIFQINTIDLVIRIVLIPLGLFYFAVNGVIAARGLIAIVVFIASALYARRLIGAPVSLQMFNLWKVGAACCALAGFELVLRGLLAPYKLHAFVELVCVTGLGAAVYAGVLLALGVRLRDLTKVGRQGAT